MFHFLLALYITAITVAIGPFIVSFFLFGRNANRLFLEGAAIMGGGTLLLVSDAAKAYMSAALLGFPFFLTVFALACTGVGSFLMVFFLPTIAYRAVSLVPPRLVLVLRFVLSILIAGLGGAKELFHIPVLAALHAVAVAAVYFYASLVVFSNYRRVVDKGLQSLLRSLAILVGCLFLLIVGQEILQKLLTVPALLRDAPFVQLAFQVSAGCVLIFHAVRYLLGPAAASEGHDLQGFLVRYGISEREREIIELMIKGLSNREIGEKLFISAQTVKNHVYNIYRKTGVTNKVQLLNLIQKRAIR